MGVGGTVFKLTPNLNGTWTESTLYHFCSLTNCSDGANPLSVLIFDAAGNLYGTTYRGWWFQSLQRRLRRGLQAHAGLRRRLDRERTV